MVKIFLVCSMLLCTMNYIGGSSLEPLSIFDVGGLRFVGYVFSSYAEYLQYIEKMSAF